MNEEAVDLKLDVADRTYKAGKTAISSDEQDAEGLSFKVPIGRPSKYHPDHCKAVLDLGSRGKSLAQMASYFNVDRHTLKNWAMEHDDFFTALSRARELAQSWWEEAGQRGLTMPGFNGNLYNKVVAGRFREDYGEKRDQLAVTVNGQETVSKVDVKLLTAEQRDQLKQLLLIAKGGGHEPE